MFGLACQQMDAAAFSALVERSAVIERDRFGEKVLLTPEGLMVKIFRRKRLLTSALIFPYAGRFARNARLLSERGIATVSVTGIARCPQLARHVVTYQPLPGETLRSRLRAVSADREQLLSAAAAFIAMLHGRGVYFRSLHFGNLIVGPETATLGLIDVADMTIRRWPLGIGLRTRNFRHLLRWSEDVDHLRAFGLERFLADYLAAAQLEPRRRQRLLDEVGRIFAGIVPPASGPRRDP